MQLDFGDPVADCNDKGHVDEKRFDHCLNKAGQLLNQVDQLGVLKLPGAQPNEIPLQVRLDAQQE